MSLYGFNRSTLNGAVSGIITGAALVTAVSGFVVDGTRVVLPDTTVNATSTTVATSLRTAQGDGGFISTSAGTAWPALLQLQTADIVVTSQLHATPTDAWALSACSLAGEGFITQPGGGVAITLSEGIVTPLVTAGFASNIGVVSLTSADASVKRTGQSTIDRDGYTQALAGVGVLTAYALKTAMGYANMVVTSSANTDSVKIHGGNAVIAGELIVQAVASTDSARTVITSGLTAVGLLTQHSSVEAVFTGFLEAGPTLTTYAEPVIATGQSTLTAAGRKALLGQSNLLGETTASASGTRVLLGTSTIVGATTGSALWTILVAGQASSTFSSGMTAFGFTNAEAPDPSERTMYRPFVDRTMYRPFNDRDMRRTS